VAGYSGTPLAKKLGIKPGATVCTLDAPKNYRQLVRERMTLVTRVDDRADTVHVFATKRARLDKALRSCVTKMRQDAALWVSWPKRSSKVDTDITEDTIRSLALPMGLVDIKVCAVDETWSGLKLVVRKENRK
jgi:Protein of unknown function (DUF3052)